MVLKNTTESRINEETLNLIRWKMSNSPEVDLYGEGAEMAIGEYRRFLILNIENPRENLAPTDLMDKAWHMHILDTRRYAEDFERMFGRFRHNHPSYNGPESNARGGSLVSAFESMKSLYSERFGHDPLDVSAGCNTDDDGSACTGVSCCDG